MSISIGDDMTTIASSFPMDGSAEDFLRILNNFGPGDEGCFNKKAEAFFLNLPGMESVTPQELELFLRPVTYTAKTYNSDHRKNLVGEFVGLFKNFQKAVRKDPSLIVKGFSFRDHEGNLIFYTFRHLFNFLRPPLFEEKWIWEHLYNRTRPDVYDHWLREGKTKLEALESLKSVINPNWDTDDLIELTSQGADLVKIAQNFSQWSWILNLKEPKTAAYAYLKGNKDLGAKGKLQKPKCLIIAAQSDYNGAISAWGELSFASKLEPYYDVSYVVARTVQDVTEIIRETSEVALLVLHAHGGESSMGFGDGEMGTLDVSTPMSETTFQNLTSEAVIVLRACNVGAGEAALVKKIAQLAHKKVIAPAARCFEMPEIKRFVPFDACFVEAGDVTISVSS